MTEAKRFKNLIILEPLYSFFGIYASVSGDMYLYTIPANTAPTSGATQNSHNWPNAQSFANKAWLVLRAGFTDVFVTGILIKWISVKPKPIAKPANPYGALECVAPKIIIKNINVITTSVIKAAIML